MIKFEDYKKLKDIIEATINNTDQKIIEIEKLFTLTSNKTRNVPGPSDWVKVDDRFQYITVDPPKKDRMHYEAELFKQEYIKACKE